MHGIVYASDSTQVVVAPIAIPKRTSLMSMQQSLRGENHVR